MRVKWMKLEQDPVGRAMVTMILDTPPSVLSKPCMDVQSGKEYEVELKPYKEAKTKDQVGAIWGKIGDLAEALRCSKDEVYETCIKRYGPSTAMRIPAEALDLIEGVFRFVDIKQTRNDGTVFVKGYKGLSEMNTQEASVLLDGILSECKEVGISAEVK